MLAKNLSFFTKDNFIDSLVIYLAILIFSYYDSNSNKKIHIFELKSLELCFKVYDIFVIIKISLNIV